MTAPSLSSLIGRVRELDKAATEAPWEADCDVYPFRVVMRGKSGLTFQVAIIGLDEEDDAYFIAESRTLLVQLADAVERMQAERDAAIADYVSVEQGFKDHWFLQGGESQFGPINTAAKNSDEIIGAILHVVRPVAARVAELEGQIAEARDLARAAHNLYHAMHQDGVSMADCEDSVCQLAAYKLAEWAAPSRPDTEK